MVRKKPRPSPIAIKRRQSTTDSEEKPNIKLLNKNNSAKAKQKPKTLQILVQHNPKVQNINRKLYKEIRSLQMNTNTLIPALPFQRLVREIMMEFCNNGAYRIQIEALRALQEATEMYVTQYLEDAYFCCIHAKRKTLYISDMQCVRRLRGRTDVINH